MAISMVRKPSVNYFVEEATNYYAEDDVYLSNSLGVTKQKYSASLENIIYGKINIDNITYLVSIKDMKIPENENISNYNSISNVDDIIPFRYAYGNQNGYVIGRGAEVSHTVNGNQFTINSGRLVVQGVESDIDANGVTLTIDSVSETRYYVVYYEINLATNTANIKLSNYSTTGYPTIDAGDDLTANSNGTARLPLYRFTAKSGAISGVEKVVKAIEYSGTALVGYDISKGTVEERLEKLGFKSGSIDSSGTITAIENQLKRQGNFVIGSFEANVLGFWTPIQTTSPYLSRWDANLGRITEDFRPKETIKISSIYNDSYEIIMQITTLGFVTASIEMPTLTVAGGSATFKVQFKNFGYEAKSL